MKANTVLTSEFVSEGHPDKVADQIADAVVDAYLGVDPFAEVACENLIAPDCVVLVGDAVSAVPVPAERLEALARGVVVAAGYAKTAMGMSSQSFDFQNNLFWRPRRAAAEK